MRIFHLDPAKWHLAVLYSLSTLYRIQFPCNQGAKATPGDSVNCDTYVNECSVR